MPKPDRFQFLGRADDISIVGDEAGFELHFSTPRGDYAVNVHGVAAELLEAAVDEIGEWLKEGAAAYASRPVPFDADAYEPDDPKHPGYSVKVAAWDEREGK